jgi:hypothetical protein
MIRWLTVVALCLCVSTLGFARLCPCDHEAAAEAVAVAATGPDDCPHSAPRVPADESLPAGDHDCGHCEACLFTPALPLTLASVEAGAPAQADFPLRVTPPGPGSPNLPLRPPIA